MPRTSKRQLAREELLNKRQRARTNLLVRYVLDSDSDVDSDDDGQEGVDGVDSGDADGPPSLERRVLARAGRNDSVRGGGGYGAEDGGSDGEDLLEELIYLRADRALAELEGSRYLDPRSYRPFDDTVFNKHLDETPGCFYNDDEFKAAYRCSRDAMDWIAGQISDHPVFNNRLGRKQVPVKQQLMLLLQFLGKEGESNRGQRSVYWCSEGHSEDARERCIEAIRSLRDKYLAWPDEDERKATAKRIFRKYQIPNVVGIIDGTLMELAFMPSCDDAADYSGRKFQWSLSTMVVNDDRGKILYFLAGFPGTSHDNRIWKRTKLYQHKEEFFSDVEYLLGDTAFEPSDIMVSTYKHMPGVAMGPDEENLNTIRSEHTIGIWKGRFPWLRKIRKRITEDTKSLVDILKYIECCAVLHNMLLEFGDESPEMWHEEVDSIDDADLAPEEEVMHQPLPGDAPKDARRTQLKLYLREHYIPPEQRSQEDEYDSDVSIAELLDPYFAH